MFASSPLSDSVRSLRATLAAALLLLPVAVHADETWKDVTPSGLADPNTTVTTVDYGNSTFVAVGINYDRTTGKGFDVSFTSKDGTSWAQHTLDFPTSGRVRFANGKFYLFGAAPTQKIFSSTDGAAWTSITDPDSEGYMVGLAVGNGVIVAARGAGLDGARVDVSTDGSKWQGVALPPANIFDTNTDIAFGAGLFTVVSAGTSLPHLFTSPDGHAWTAQTSLSNGNGYIFIAYGNGTFLTQENGISQKISTDGVTWTTATPGLTQTIPGFGTLGLAMRFGRFLNGQFIGVGGGSYGFSLYNSADAQNWTSFGTVATSSDYIRDVAFGAGHYIALTGKNIYVNTAGSTTVVKKPDLSVDFSGVKVGPNAVGTKTKFKGTLTVTNSGKKPAADVQVAAYLSADQAFSAKDDQFISTLSLSDLGVPTLAKKSSTGPLTAKFVAKTSDLGTTSGKYLLIVVDPLNAIDETDETNNVFVYGPLP